MFIRLEWQNPDTGQRNQKVARLPVTLGRAPTNSIILPFSGVSREHAKLEERSGTLVLTDLGSRNGMIVDGQLVRNVSLTGASHTVQLGAVTLTVARETSGVGAVPRSISAETWQQADEFIIEYNDPKTGGRKRDRSRLPITIGRTDGMRVSLRDNRVSRYHAEIQRQQGQLVIIDQNSDSGTFLNGKKLKPNQPARLSPGSTITIVKTDLKIYPASIIEADRDTDTVFPPEQFQREKVDLAALQRLNYPVEEVEYLTIGGGLGSFIWADHLVVFGVPPQQIRAIGFGSSSPYERYEDLCTKSQIPPHERLRSNSDSCPDNIWGWPGYAVREAYTSIKEGDFRTAGWVLWQIFGEPTLVETYTPKSGVVFRSIDREAERIGWSQIWREGRARAIRKTTDGRYVVAYVTKDRSNRYRFVVGRYLHLAIGYPAFRLVKELQTYREQTGDNRSVVNAYEDHEHVYRQLQRNGGGTVVVRGRGIVSSRIVQKLYELRRDLGVNVQVINMGRSLLQEGTGEYNGVRRPIANNWEFQPFNWPKANWGGDLRVVLESASRAERKHLYKQWGGTTTADRTDWQEIVRDGLLEGWYTFAAGTAQKIIKNDVGRLEIHLDPTKARQLRQGPNGQQEHSISTIQADFIVDGTGLISKVDRHPLLHDLISHYHLSRNVNEGLDVENDFEMLALRNDRGRVYACGVSTLGGPYAPVDSFLGLQYACLQSVDALVKENAPNLKKLNFLSSANQWLKWARGVRP